MTSPAVDALADRLEAAIPEQRELSLVHGDFHVLNVISTPSGDEIRAVLDWELCTLGDPLADVGSLLAYWPEAGDVGAGPVPDPALPGFPSRAEMAQAYAEETGRDLSALPFWHALGLWKVAIIGEGVRKRAPSTPATRSASGVLATDYLAGPGRPGRARGERGRLLNAPAAFAWPAGTRGSRRPRRRAW